MTHPLVSERIVNAPPLEEVEQERQGEDDVVDKDIVYPELELPMLTESMSQVLKESMNGRRFAEMWETLMERDETVALVVGEKCGTRSIVARYDYVTYF